MRIFSALFAIVFEVVLVPAVAMAQRHRHGGRHRRGEAVTSSAEEEDLRRRFGALVQQAQSPGVQPHIAAERLMEAYSLRSDCGLLFNAGNRFEAGAASANASDVNERRGLLERARDAYDRYRRRFGVEGGSCPAPPDPADAESHRQLLSEAIDRVTMALNLLASPAPVPAPAPEPPPTPVIPPVVLPVEVPVYRYTRPVLAASVGLWVGGTLLTGVGVYTFVNSIRDFVAADDPGEDQPRRQLAAEINMYVAVPSMLVGLTSIGYATYRHINRPTVSTRLPVALLPNLRPGFAGIAVGGTF